MKEGKEKEKQQSIVNKLEKNIIKRVKSMWHAIHTFLMFKPLLMLFELILHF